MIRAHLTPAEYRRIPWANRRGETLELLRREGTEGQLLLRLSVAQVVEDGAFSRLPGIDRVLTVISGPGFDLAGGGLRLHADPLCPVAFFGDVAIAAELISGGPASDGAAARRADLRLNRVAESRASAKRFAASAGRIAQ